MKSTCTLTGPFFQNLKTAFVFSILGGFQMLSSAAYDFKKGSNTLPIDSFSTINWGTAASQPFSVSEAQGEVVNGKLYSFGGFDSQKSCCTPTNRAFVYDPVLNNWASLANMPAMNSTAYGGVTHAGFANDGVDIYFAGGYTSNSIGIGQMFGTREAWKYIISENRYVRLPDLPIVISAGQMEFLNGKLHHIGGTNSSRTADLGNHYVLDLNNLSAGWIAAASLPVPRQHAGSAVYNNMIYYIGGQMGHDDNLVTSKLVHRYNVATNTWSQVSDLPVPSGANGRGHISSAVTIYEDRIIVLGGETVHNSATNMVSAYRPATNSWENLTPLPASRRSGIAGVLNANIYYSGGGTSVTYRGIPVQSATAGCTPESTLPCESITIGLPFNLSFNAATSNTLIDKNNQGTGFTMVNAYSGTRLSADGTPSNTSVPGYESSKLTLGNGRLQIVSNKGIAYLTNNNQLNALGVRFNASNPYQVETVLINPFNGTSAQQAGIWIGQNDKTFLKLVVVGSKLEFRKEVNDVSGTSDIRVTGTISGLNTQTVRLRITVTPATGVAEAFYSTDGTNFVNVGATYAMKGLSISGMNLTGSTASAGIFATHRNASTSVTYTFDNFSITGTGTQPITACSPTSTLPCSALQINLPFNLTFNAATNNTLADKNNQGIGFTLVDAYSGTRLSADGTPSNTSVPGYEPSKLTLGNGRLQIVSNKGIAYLTNNNQLNALGVRFNASNPYQVETVLINPFNGTSAQQAGIWIGQNDKTFLKLVVVGSKLEFRKEVNDVSGTSDMRVTGTISGLNTQTVRLRIIVTPATGVAEAFYSTDGTNFLNVGATYAVKGLSISGMNLTGSTASAGIFATHRSSSTPVTYTFDNFSITGTVTPPPPPPASANPGAYMVIENRDQNFPAPDHLVFSRIQNPWDGADNFAFNYNHDRVTLRIHNKGTAALTVNALSISKSSVNVAWKIAQINSDVTARWPISITAGSFADVVVNFIAVDEATRVKTIHDTLYISSGDPSFPMKKIMLHGNFQLNGEGGNEPRAQEVLNTFAFKTRTGFSGSDGSTNRGTVIVPNSDEVIPSFFVRADPIRPVTVTQMAAYHTCCNTRESFQWYVKGSTTNTTLFSHYAADGQSHLPRLNSSTATTSPALAKGTFNPIGAFGIKSGTAYSDRTRNYQQKIGMRIWKAIDPSGRIIPNAYIIGTDYLGTSFTNYDYQDNIYYVENVRPETGTVFYSELAAQPSAVSFTNVNSGSTGNLSATIKNLGTSYSDGTSDPPIVIQKVEIVGQHASEFSASMPSLTTLTILGSTSVPVRFAPTTPGIKNAALNVYYNSSKSPLRIPLYGISNSSTTTVSNIRRIKSNAGVSMAINGQTWEADINYRIGNVKLDTQNPKSDVAGTDVDILYQTYLSSNANFDEIRYEIPIVNGNYMVRMHHVENVWQAPGLRVFNVSIENQLKYSFLDIFKEVGYRAALVKDYETTVTDGVLSIKFNPSADRLAIAGLEIFSMTGSQTLSIKSLEDFGTTSIIDNLIPRAQVMRSYPNPNSGDRIFVELSNFGVRENVTIQLHDILGRQIKSIIVITDDQGRLNTELNLSTPLNKEVYIIRASSTSGMKQSKIIVE